MLKYSIDVNRFVYNIFGYCTRMKTTVISGSGRIPNHNVREQMGKTIVYRRHNAKPTDLL